MGCKYNPTFYICFIKWKEFDKVLHSDKLPHRENHFIRKFVQETDFILNNFSLKNRRNYQPFFNLNYKLFSETK